MAAHWSDVDHWVGVFKDEYLPTAKYEGDDSIPSCEERAIESFASELRAALQEAEREWWEEKERDDDPGDIDDGFPMYLEYDGLYGGADFHTEQSAQEESDFADFYFGGGE